MSVQRRWKGLFARNVLYCYTEVFALELFQYFFVYGVLHYYYMSSWTYMFSFLCNIQPFNKACRKIKPLQHFCHSREGSTCKNFMNHNLPMRHNHIHIKRCTLISSISLQALVEIHICFFNSKYFKAYNIQFIYFEYVSAFKVTKISNKKLITLDILTRKTVSHRHFSFYNLSSHTEKCSRSGLFVWL